MNAPAFEPDLSQPGAEEVWFAQTGGTTDPARAAFQRFVRQRLPWGWHFEKARGVAKYTVQFKHGPAQEAVVFLTFLGQDGTRVTFGTDGFGWGYPGTGPGGLADCLTDALFGPKNGLWHQHRFAITQFLNRIKLDADWSATADELRLPRA
jgi:hypothetical protein